MNVDDAQEIGYRKGLIKGRELQKEDDAKEIIEDLIDVSTSIGEWDDAKLVGDLILKWKRKKQLEK